MVNDTDISHTDLLTLEQDVLENSRQINEIPLQLSAAHAMEAISYDQAEIITELGEIGKKKGRTAKKRKRNLDKDGKEPQLNTCLAVGCERQIRQRRLCPMHQKQKERNNGKIEIKENVKFNKGRTPTPFSKHANKYAKLKIFDRKIDEWAGGKEEGSMMLESYLDSSYYQGRFQKQEDYRVYEQIGRNMVEFMRYLPEKSPLRRPLIKAISENVPMAKLREVLPVSKQTVLNSKKLPDQDNLLLTIRYKPNVTRKRKGNGMEMEGMDDLADDLHLHGGQSGPQLEPPQVDSSSHDIIQATDLQGLPLSFAPLTSISHLVTHM
eukprot:TRINITY_DN588_c0_g1_i1.p1 TRINITY_DN588_c0_g1~~TRINITY_DN588_c0_g1_i1.p1  ORF type:complete len:373 (-),score=92.05 TRINITY_DN588_c0_g1_i1:74-1042(-)